ncbi:divalent-cation tolerance protein CutA [Advenella sp. S44]|uniref:divalent-cation tolerance protein CutA n=1 Tax=Advenella sp. S44 TaxID=1982755 RepID=UPI000C2A3C8C|nr:divalent-cation tolerance protein CutA [Advenella sp. S44]PJX27717.1 divalent-cation tolerance protein CutA [Advenella sp. S44]
MTTECVVMYTTVPDTLLAKRIAHVLVEEHLAACVNLSPASLSIYLWEENVEGTEEITLTIKTSSQASVRCQERIVQLHPYDVPEIIILPVLGGHVPYLDWVRAQTSV